MWPAEAAAEEVACLPAWLVLDAAVPCCAEAYAWSAAVTLLWLRLPDAWPVTAGLGTVLLAARAGVLWAELTAGAVPDGAGAVPEGPGALEAGAAEAEAAAAAEALALRRAVLLLTDLLTVALPTPGVVTGSITMALRGAAAPLVALLACPDAAAEVAAVLRVVAGWPALPDAAGTALEPVD